MRVVILDEPAPGVEILVDGRVATVREVRADGSIVVEYVDGTTGTTVLPEDECDPS